MDIKYFFRQRNGIFLKLYFLVDMIDLLYLNYPYSYPSIIPLFLYPFHTTFQFVHYLLYLWLSLSFLYSFYFFFSFSLLLLNHHQIAKNMIHHEVFLYFFYLPLFCLFTSYICKNQRLKTPVFECTFMVEQEKHSQMH